VLEWMRGANSTIFVDVEQALLSEYNITLRRPQVLNALHVAQRVAAVDALAEMEEGRRKEALQHLYDQKQAVESHFLIVVQGTKGDVDCARNFAELYHASIQAWIEHEVTNFAAEVRMTVLNEMPDPSTAGERAFQQSFQARNWEEVLEYCIDVNSYLEKLFLKLFHRRKRGVVDTKLPALEERVRGTYKLLREIPEVWASKEEPTTAKDTIQGTAIPAARTMATETMEVASDRPAFTVKSFKMFVEAWSKQKDPHTQALRQVVAGRLPPSANFDIRSPKNFSEAFRNRLMTLFEELQHDTAWLSSKVEKGLHEQSVQAWGMIRGCAARCPLCGSKCDCHGEHEDHQCKHHLFPAFHGWMDRVDGSPSFNYCRSQAASYGTYQCTDGEWRGLDEYLRDSHPSWHKSFVETKTTTDDETILKAAWMNVRMPLLVYFSPMADSYAEEWEAHIEKSRLLPESALEKAKKTITAIRRRTYVASDDIPQFHPRGRSSGAAPKGKPKQGDVKPISL